LSKQEEPRDPGFLITVIEYKNGKKNINSSRRWDR